VTSASDTCRCSTSRSPAGWASRRVCACTRRHADAPSHSSTTATCTRATTTSSLATCWGTSPRARWRGSSTRLASGRSGPRRARRCPVSAADARCASRATAVPEGPLHRNARRRNRPQLPVHRLPRVLPPRRRADADHGRSAGPRATPSPDRAALRHRDARRGRNDPCTCASGRKWKNCHGADRPSR